MNNNSFFQINAPHVIFEQFDAEVVVVNLESGFYYSLDATASCIWLALVAGQTVEQILALMHQRDQQEAGALEQPILDFVKRLLEEKLLIETNGSIATKQTDHIFSDLEQQAILAPPTMERFEDMQDMLLLDPIHEVDDMGWPHAKT